MIHTSFSRLKKKKGRNFKEWIEYVGRDHVHHRLESLGLNKKWAVMFIFLFEICLGASAAFIRQVNNFTALLLIAQGIGIVTLFNILEFLGNKKGN